MTGAPAPLEEAVAASAVGLAGAVGRASGSDGLAVAVVACATVGPGIGAAGVLVDRCTGRSAWSGVHGTGADGPGEGTVIDAGAGSSGVGSADGSAARDAGSTTTLGRSGDRPRVGRTGGVAAPLVDAFRATTGGTSGDAGVGREVAGGVAPGPAAVVRLGAPVVSRWTAGVVEAASGADAATSPWCSPEGSAWPVVLAGRVTRGSDGRSASRETVGVEVASDGSSVRGAPRPRRAAVGIACAKGAVAPGVDPPVGAPGPAGPGGVMPRAATARWSVIGASTAVGGGVAIGDPRPWRGRATGSGEAPAAPSDGRSAHRRADGVAVVDGVAAPGRAGAGAERAPAADGADRAAADGPSRCTAGASSDGARVRGWAGTVAIDVGATLGSVRTGARVSSDGEADVEDGSTLEVGSGAGATAAVPCTLDEVDSAGSAAALARRWTGRGVSGAREVSEGSGDVGATTSPAGASGVTSCPSGSTIAGSGRAPGTSARNGRDGATTGTAPTVRWIAGRRAHAPVGGASSGAGAAAGASLDVAPPGATSAVDGPSELLRPNGHGRRTTPYSSSERRWLIRPISSTNRSRSGCSRSRIVSIDQWK
jgi:hypothetical protein